MGGAGRAYSQDLRERVLAGSDRGLLSGTVAARFAASVSCVIKARQRRERTGEVRALTPHQTRCGGWPARRSTKSQHAAEWDRPDLVAVRAA